jgi:dihydroxy-acid dehydratase
MTTLEFGDFNRKPRLKPEQLRSHRWFGRENVPSKVRAFTHRTRMNQAGRDESEYMGKPIIGILNDWSDLNMCHMHFRDRAEEIKRGVLAAGGFPVEIGVPPLGEILMKPWASHYRNLSSIVTEEMLRAYPIDCGVLMGGCDKSIPAHLMGGLSLDIPIIVFPAGPMKRGTWRGKNVASGTTAWQAIADCGAGVRPMSDLKDLENHEGTSTGTCMSMNTATTMMQLTEVLGFSLPGAGHTPAVAAQHGRAAVLTGRLAVELAWRDFKPSEFLTHKSFENAIIAYMALAGSTNGILHLMAIAGRAGIELSMDDFDGVDVPVLANIAPSGEHVMEDFHEAGGLAGLLNTRLRDRLHLDCMTVTGKTLGENIADGEVFNEDVIRPLDNPLRKHGGLRVIRGNLAPDGAILKTAAASPELFQHRGKAVVFQTPEEIENHINDEKYKDIITKDSVLVMLNTGMQGYPGFPELGDLPIPDHVLKQGVRDMVRISDARMSGTCYGTQIVHIAPEAYIGGPIAFVQTGDDIELNVEKGELNLLISEEEMARRKAEWKPPEPRFTRGYYKLNEEQVEQPDKGCDWKILKGKGGGPKNPRIG